MNKPFEEISFPAKTKSMKSIVKTFELKILMIVEVTTLNIILIQTILKRGQIREIHGPKS